VISEKSLAIWNVSSSDLSKHIIPSGYVRISDPFAAAFRLALSHFLYAVSAGLLRKFLSHTTWRVRVE
jgi:hypothetical protein